MKPIKIYFTDLKLSKQRELLPKLREFFDGEIPSPFVEFDTMLRLLPEIDSKETPFGKIMREIGEMPYLDPHERREQDAQLRAENQEPEPEREDGEVEF